jgi:arylsulfatase B
VLPAPTLCARFNVGDVIGDMSMSSLGFYQRAYTPLQRGFDEHMGYLTGEITYYNHTRSAAMGNGGDYCCGGHRLHAGLDWNRGNLEPCPADDGKYTTPLIEAQANDFIRRQAAARQRFFLYLPFHLVHEPNQVPDEFLQRYPATAPPNSTINRTCDMNAPWLHCRTVLAMASALDDAVGSIFQTLQQAPGDAANYTITVFSSDNGAPPGQGGSNAPYRGWKMQLYEGGVKVPGFVHSPLLPAAVRGTVDHRCVHPSD